MNVKPENKKVAIKTSVSVNVWAFGNKQSLDIDTTFVTNGKNNNYKAPDNDEQCVGYLDPLMHTNRKKTIGAIILHCTGANNPAERSVEYWNRLAKEIRKNGQTTDKSDENGQQNSQKSKVPQKTSAAYILERCPTKIDPKNDPFPLLHRVVEDNRVTWHTNWTCLRTIGIEIANSAYDWTNASTVSEPTLQKGDVDPKDENAFIRPVKIAGFANYKSWQAFQDIQYENLIKFIRYLCIEYNIPRQFLGKTTAEMFTSADPQRSEIDNFKGILHHRNVQNKVCPGILHRNRIYRGITEEWWLPCEMDGSSRTYYSGPFQMPEYVEGCQQPGFFRWQGTTFVKDDTCVDPDDESDELMNLGHFEPVVDSTTYSGADIDAIAEYKSYYDRNNNAAHYGYCEKPGGTYPIGANRSWHGGVHFFPKPGNAAVYAAASGTIVAARIHSHEDTDFHPDFGSQRFVLIRHAVHELGDDGKVNYKADPRFVFSLYMHLDKFADATKEDPGNPPWFNIWLRGCGESAPNIDALQDDRGIVFAPNIEVLVGDILGIAGRFGKDQPCLHFEIFTPKESLKIDNQKTRPSKELFEDPSDKDGYCDNAYLDSVLTAKMHKGLDDADPILAACLLREAKTYHVSEWAFSKNALDKIYDLEIKKHPNDKTRLEKSRDEDWVHIHRFLWWEDACNVDQELAQIIGRDGFAYFYHPVTFIQCVNENAALEYTDIPKLTGGKKKELPEEDGKPIRLNVTFSGISQQSSGMLQVVGGEMLHYSGYVNGEYVGTVSANGSCLGVTISIGNKWNRETTVFENKSLTILVHCYAESEKSKQTGVLSTAKCVLTKNSSTPWGASQDSIVMESSNGLFTVFFAVRELKES